jgi:hypothetical protein
LGGATPHAAVNENIADKAERHKPDSVMRIAAFYDIHGNLPALEAVLREVREAEVDTVVVGGDVVPGPIPQEVLDCLLN